MYYLGPVKQKCQRKIAIIFSSTSINMCFGCSNDSFEYSQHLFWLRNKKIIFSYALLSEGLNYYSSFSSLSFSFFSFLARIFFHFAIFKTDSIGYDLAALPRRGYLSLKFKHYELYQTASIGAV